MKYIKLFVGEITNPNISGDKTVKARAILSQIVGTNQMQGMSVGDMRHACAILDKLDSAGDESHLALEDAEYEHLKTRVQSHRFPVADRVFIRIVEEVENATADAPPHLKAVAGGKK